MKHRVLITCPNLINTIDHYRDFFASHDIDIMIPDFVQQLSEAQLLNLIGEFDGVIAGDDPFTERVFEKATRLKVMAKWGVGVDSIDLEAAKRLKIPVFNTPGAFSDEVADVAMGYVILLARQLHRIDRTVRQGKWEKPLGTSLRGKRLGIIGVGGIGQAITQRCVAAGMVPLGYDVRDIPDGFRQQTGMQQLALNDLFSQADFIVLSCNLTSENYHLLDDSAFEKMHDGVYIVNVSRGPLIDEVSLLKYLGTKKVAGAAMDVFEHEPLSPQSDLHLFENCIFGSHNSSNTREAVMRVNDWTIQNLLRGLNGEVP